MSGAAPISILHAVDSCKARPVVLYKSMAVDAQRTRDRILTTGLHLLSKNGLAGVSLGALAEHAGMSKSGLFAHFRSKDAVQIALLNAAVELGSRQIGPAAAAAEPGLPRLAAVFRVWCGWAARAGLPGGCPLAAATFEMDDGAGAIRDHIIAIETAWRGQLSGYVHDAIAAGHLRADLDVDQFVWELNGIYLAHHVSERFHRSVDASQRAQIAFEALIQRSRA